MSDPQHDDTSPEHDNTSAEHDNTAAGGGDAPLGGDETTEQQLEADNPVEEATLAALDPDNAPA